MRARTAIFVAAIAVLAGLASEHVRHVWPQPLWIPVADLAIGWSLVGSGLVASVARPRQSAGRLLVLAGFLWIMGAPRQWFSGTSGSDDFMQLDALSFTLVGWSDVVLAFIALSFAARWPERRRDRVAMVGLVAAFAFQTTVRLVLRAPELVGFELTDSSVAVALVGAADIARLSVLAATGLLMLQRWSGSSPPARHLLGPVLLAGAASALVPLYAILYPLSQFGLVAPVPETVAVPTLWVTNAVRMVVPVAMLLGILRQRGSRAAVADAIATVGHVPSSDELQTALVSALGDPSLRVLTWDREAGAYLDGAGQATALPAGMSGPTATLVPGPDGPLAAIVHDRVLAEDPGLVAAGVAMTRLVIEHQQLSRQLLRQLDEVRASRVRILEAGDAERRRIEHDLHDGVQQRLLALALSLRRASATPTIDAEAAAALDRGADEALGVVSDVRILAQGVHPAVLSEAGLGAALRALAVRSPVPVDVELDLDGRVGTSAAATGYFVASEALANVVKHASASSVTLRAIEHDDWLHLDVSDDGRGGADPRGRGLRGLDDRVTAIGGTLSISGRPGGGTTVAASIPLR